MKRYVFIALIVASPFVVSGAFAEDSAPAAQADAPAAVAPEAPVDAAPAAPVAEAKTQDNLEFVSGEVTAVDDAAKSVSVKLYGETEEETSDKSITVKVDEATDITDGEKDRELKSLASGTEVDVEYDPATSKATYIFVY